MSDHLQLHYSDMNGLCAISRYEHMCIHEHQKMIINSGRMIGKSDLVKYRNMIKRGYKIRIWNDRVTKWLIKQKEPIKVQFT